MKTLPHDHGQKFEQMREQIPGPEAFQIVADLFKQMGDLSRVRIFWLLCHCEECVINISSLMEMSSPAVSPSSQATENDRTDHQPPGW